MITDSQENSVCMGLMTKESEFSYKRPSLLHSIPLPTKSVYQYGKGVPRVRS